jgi:hypothetical protein
MRAAGAADGDAGALTTRRGAAGLGVPVGRRRALALLCIVLLVATTCAICGPIAFVALLAGPIVYGDLTHMAIYNQSSLRQLLANAGFERMSFHETGPIPKNLVGGVRCVIWGVARALANVVRLAESGGRQEVWTQNILCCAYRPLESSR